MGEGAIAGGNLISENVKNVGNHPVGYADVVHGFNTSTLFVKRLH